MEARVVDVMKERRLIAEGVECSLRTSISNITFIDGEEYYMTPLHFSHAIGYESTARLNFVEERFLTSCFGRKGTRDMLTYIASNHICTSIANVFQDIFHFTFEAGGQQFPATVYGNCQVEVVSAQDNMGRTYP